MNTLSPSKKEISPICEVEIHYKRKQPFSEMPKINNSQDADRIFREIIDPNKIDLKEFFFVALLSHANRVLGVSEISRGAVSQTCVNIKEIFQLALKANASGIILAHNHPSGNLKPSETDKALTSQVSNGGKLLEIKLIDHLILTSESHFSFADESLI